MKKIESSLKMSSPHSEFTKHCIALKSIRYEVSSLWVQNRLQKCTVFQKLNSFQKMSYFETKIIFKKIQLVLDVKSVFTFQGLLKFIYSEKATKFWEISIVDLSSVVPVKSTVEISKKNMNFTILLMSLHKRLTIPLSQFGFWPKSN